MTNSNEGNPQYFSPGIHYLISTEFEIRVRTGWGLNQDAANFFTNVGVGVRF
ncbi:transporter [Symmachiella macrocystis]|uniref:transporter n=1 Tax=Symmachiella macrocystis TaxID=2527985 RepID=UPI0011B7C60B|nr:transporter [Symmachiella macrocystis]